MGQIEDEINEMFGEYEEFQEIEFYDITPIEYILYEEWNFTQNRIKSNLTGGKKPAAE